MKKSIFVFLLAAVLIAGCGTADKTEDKAADTKAMPAFSLNDIDDTVFDSASLQGKVVIIDFWATWCPPCKKEIPHFIELHEEYKDQGLLVVGISVDEDINALEEFVKDNNVNYISLKMDKEQKIVGLFGGIKGIPTTFIVDREGNIVEKFVGYRDKEVFVEAIEKLL